MKDREAKLGKNAKKAEALKEAFTDEMKLAAEAMSRTTRRHRFEVLEPRRYAYYRIF